MAWPLRRSWFRLFWRVDARSDTCSRKTGRGSFLGEGGESSSPDSRAAFSSDASDPPRSSSDPKYEEPSSSTSSLPKTSFLDIRMLLYLGSTGLPSALRIADGLASSYCVCNTPTGNHNRLTRLQHNGTVQHVNSPQYPLHQQNYHFEGGIGENLRAGR